MKLGHRGNHHLIAELLRSEVAAIAEDTLDRLLARQSYERTVHTHDCPKLILALIVREGDPDSRSLRVERNLDNVLVGRICRHECQNPVTLWIDNLLVARARCHGSDGSSEEEHRRMVVSFSHQYQ